MITIELTDEECIWLRLLLERFTVCGEMDKEDREVMDSILSKIP